jgi:3-hydroxyacyl-CoA dehydrogenase
MGAELAAHLSNAGLPVLLFDLTLDQARAGLDRARRARPDRFFVAQAAALVEPLGFEHLSRLAEADWIIEAIVEDMDAKRQVLARVEAHRAPESIVSTNTSSLSVTMMAEGRSDSFRRHWLGTHFFNPPRYLTLVEVIPTRDTDPDVTARTAAFLDHRLGKGVVMARDTPAFIANRLGIFGAIRAIEAVASGDYSIEDVDALTGPVLGRPKSATFRTADIAGLDVLAHVAADLVARLPEDERRWFVVPPLVREMLARGQLGEKSGHGFYKRVQVGGETRILTLDVDTFGYREPRAIALPALHAASADADPAVRIRSLFLRRDRTGDLLRRTLGATLVYAADVACSMAPSIDDIDRAMRWGFGWALGPFETWDAIGVRDVLDRCRATDPLLATLSTELGAGPSMALRAGQSRFRDAPLAPAQPDLLILQSAKARSGVVRANAGASLVDLGDGVLAVEFHSKMNTIGTDAVDLLRAAVAEAAANFTAMVIGSEAPHFSAGADLTRLLFEAQEGHWDKIDAMVRAFQGVTMALKTAAVPVVAAPAGLALGGGSEICLHTDRVQAAAETYMGLVEVGVGLIPAGGGTKEMLLRAIDAAPARTDMHAVVARVFETIGFAKTSTSAPHARQLGYLRDVDEITMNRERVIADAKRVALARVAAGYQPPPLRLAIPVGGADLFASLALGVHLAARAGRISDHDARIGRTLAWVLTGGDAPHATTVSEQYLLDLEREAFLSLCGEQKTLERIAHTLTTGKPLRN